MSKETNRNLAVPMKEKLSYGIASGGGNIITQILGTFLTSYLTDSVGVAAAAVGTMMLVTRIIDAFSDVIMGGIIDKTHTKWGKARPWLLISAPLILIALVLTFSANPSWGDGAKVAYMYFSYIFLNCICYTIFMVSHTSLLSRISLDGNERQKMASMNQNLNQVGGLAVTTFMLILVNFCGWQMTAVIYGVVTCICILIGFFFTREHVGENENGEVKTETVPLNVALPAMLKNKYFYLLTAMFVLILMQAAGPGSMTYYYCNNVVNNLGLLSFISACGIVPMMIMNLFIPSLARKFGRRKLLIVGALGDAFGFFLCGMFSNSLPMIYAGSLLKGFSAGFLFACGFAMASDVVDYGEYKTGVRSEGLINSCVSFGQKVGLGLGPAIASWVLDASGYNGAVVEQSQSAINAICFGYGYYGMILALLIAVIAFFMDLDKKQDEIRIALEAKHHG
ncbi:MAG: glycoside-pentoside-hexuronide (GPH):cation symporter [Fusicatenibacter sp.]|nr:glycoside-pentoside-hexuronide (GPH):cation symporter [Fusicatenibacter sp.]